MDSSSCSANKSLSVSLTSFETLGVERKAFVWPFLYLFKQTKISVTDKKRKETRPAVQEYLISFNK